MSFQIHALAREPFEQLFALSDAELAERNAVRRRVDVRPGYPCRVSLEDAEIGEDVVLLNYEHQAGNSPYKASHAIFVRETARQAQPAVNEIPESIALRLLSVRAFDASDCIVNADVVHGSQLAEAIDAMLQDERVAYLHLHNAKPGCYAARVTRT